MWCVCSDTAISERWQMQWRNCYWTANWMTQLVLSHLYVRVCVCVNYWRMLCVSCCSRFQSLDLNSIRCFSVRRCICVRVCAPMQVGVNFDMWLTLNAVADGDAAAFFFFFALVLAASIAVSKCQMSVAIWWAQRKCLNSCNCCNCYMLLLY